MKRLLVVVLSAVGLSALACEGQPLEQAEALVQVVDATVQTSTSQGPLMVTVLGTLRNQHGERVENLMLEARLTDASGKVVDVLSQPLYGLVVPASGQIAFRLQGSAAVNAAVYAGVKARVVSAESHAGLVSPSHHGNAERNWNIAVAWGPMLLLIAVWILLARRYNGKGSTQDKLLDAMGEQNALLARQAAAIERMAASAAPPVGPGPGGITPQA